MKLNFRFFSNSDQNLQFIKRLVLILGLAMRYLSFGTFGVLIYRMGYDIDPTKVLFISKLFELMVFLLGLVIILRNLFSNMSRKNKRLIFEMLVAVFLVISALLRWRAFGDFSEDALFFTRKYSL